MRNKLKKILLIVLVITLSRCSKSELEVAHKLYIENCVICHSIDGSQKIGPSLKEIYGRNAELIDGTIITRDDSYLRNSIIYPEKHIVKDSRGAMISYQNILSSYEIELLIKYIKNNLEK
tara:strand:- start:164 stop:523 length:360 start_codon:yes stop_codon:yes gene_type:complete